MSDALINKYRPTKFSAVLGQEAVVKSLQAVIKKRASQAFLLSGPAGTGKTTLSRIAAAELGCAPSDITEVDGASKTGIDDMRQVAETLIYRPIGGGEAKAIIVDECQALSKAAVTSLL